MPALQLQVAGDAAVGDPAVDRRDHLDPPRPVMGAQRPFDRGAVRMSHAHESSAAQRRLAPRVVAEPNRPRHQRPPQVELVAVVEQLNICQPDGVLALDPQPEHEPVGQVYEVLVEHRDAAEDRRLPVIDAVRVGPRVVDSVGVLPLGGATRAEMPVTRRGQHFAQTLLIGIKALVGERKLLHGGPSDRQWDRAATLPPRRFAVKLRKFQNSTLVSAFRGTVSQASARREWPLSLLGVVPSQQHAAEQAERHTED